MRQDSQPSLQEASFNRESRLLVAWLAERVKAPRVGHRGVPPGGSRAAAGKAGAEPSTDAEGHQRYERKDVKNDINTRTQSIDSRNLREKPSWRERL
jgi:hypothetical protein